MTASAARGYRYAQGICVLLVGFLCLAFLWKSPAGPSMADQFVTTTRSNATGPHANSPESVGSTPAPAVVDVGTGDTHALDPALRLAREALPRFETTVDD